jgi:predicted TIM-barrel enzyme
LADALIVSGSETGRAAPVEDLQLVKRSVPTLPVLVGSGVTPAHAPTLLAQADGLIVGTGIKRGGIVQEPVDIDCVREIVAGCSDQLFY